MLVICDRTHLHVTEDRNSKLGGRAAAGRPRPSSQKTARVGCTDQVILEESLGLSNCSHTHNFMAIFTLTWTKYTRIFFLTRFTRFVSPCWSNKRMHVFKTALALALYFFRSGSSADLHVQSMIETLSLYSYLWIMNLQRKKKTVVI